MKIMVGYDGSNASKEALEVAGKHAAAFNAQVEIVTSMTRGTDSQRNEIEQAERGLEYAKSVLAEKKVSCRTHLLIRGLSSGEDLVEFSRENQIDLIVLGVKRRSKVGKLLMGSTAQHVILESECPVIAVK